MKSKLLTNAKKATVSVLYWYKSFLSSQELQNFLQKGSSLRGRNFFYMLRQTTSSLCPLSSSVLCPRSLVLCPPHGVPSAVLLSLREGSSCPFGEEASLFFGLCGPLVCRSRPLCVVTVLGAAVACRLAVFVRSFCVTVARCVLSRCLVAVWPVGWLSLCRVSVSQ